MIMILMGECVTVTCAIFRVWKSKTGVRNLVLKSLRKSLKTSQVRNLSLRKSRIVRRQRRLFLNSRILHYLLSTGPSVQVNTYCSTKMSAYKAAYLELRLGDATLFHCWESIYLPFLVLET